MPREFRARREHLLPAAPEQVWRAVTTGRGNSGWLYPMDIEPRVGGTVSRGPATVTVWEPGHRFACRFDDGAGFSNTLGYEVGTGAAGTTRLTMTIHWVHQGEPDDGWDTRADAAERHIDFYHHSLAEYLRHFDGRPATYVRAGHGEAPAAPGDFAALLARIGIPADAVPGDAVTLTPPGRPPLPGELDFLSADFAGVRTADGLYRFFNGEAWGWPLWAGHHLFADDVDADAETAVWNTCVEGVPA